MAYETASKIVSGRKAVTTAGTPEKLVATATGCFKVLISADIGNAGAVILGDQNIVQTSKSQQGVILTPGNPPVEFQVRDVSIIYVDALNSGDAVCFVYFVT